MPSELKLKETARGSVAAQALIGEHPSIVKLRQLLRRVAVTDATVLISGESGSGKEIVAQTIHAHSNRRN